MKNFFIKNWYKISNQNKYKRLKQEENIKKRVKFYRSNIESQIYEIQKKIKENKKLNFVHSGHVGDLLYSLPVIKELSKNHDCFLYIKKNRPINVEYIGHPSGNVLLDENIINKLLPLLKSQPYLKSVEIYNNEKIDINLDLYRDIPINISFHQFRWYIHITGVHINMEDPYLFIDNIKNFQDKIILLRTFRNRNHFINYKFLRNYKNLLFIGLKNEFVNLKEEIPNLEFYDCKDFLEMAKIIKSCKFYLGNLSAGYAISEGLKVPRLLEACSDFPAVYPIGNNSYDFYHQCHFESLFKEFYNKNF